MKPTIIVAVELVVVVSLPGERGSQPREIKREVNGTVISPAGLTVTSLGGIDPRAAGVAGPQKGEGGDAEFKEVKLSLADGTEIPAHVVLKDADLDLAFIAPEEAAQNRSFAFVNLENTAEAVVLGNYYDMTRVNKTLQRVPIVRATTVVGVVEKPRRLILMSEQSLSCPIFDEHDRVLGISLRYITNGVVSGIVVLPAADVAEMARQAEAAGQAATVRPEPVETAPAAPASAPATAPPAG